MKTCKIIVLAAAAALLALTLSGCDLFGDKVSVSERIDMFVIDANAYAYASLQAHTHPDAGQYSQANYGYWESVLNNYIPLSVTSTSASTATASGTGGVIFTFYLKEDAPNVYKIYRIEKSGTTTPVFQ